MRYRWTVRRAPRVITGSLVSTLSPTVVNEFRLGTRKAWNYSWSSIWRPDEVGDAARAALPTHNGVPFFPSQALIPDNIFTSINGVKFQTGTTASGRYAFVTGAPAGAHTNSNDLDGVTTIRSVPIALPAEPGDLSFRYVFAHGPSSAEDGIKVWVEDEAAVRTLVWSRDGSASTVGAAWVRAAVPLTPFAGTSIRIVIQAADGGPDSLVEVELDDIRVERHVAS